jgi:hypothetical protein
MHNLFFGCRNLLQKAILVGKSEIHLLGFVAGGHTNDFRRKASWTKLSFKVVEKVGEIGLLLRNMGSERN